MEPSKTPVSTFPDQDEQTLLRFEEAWECGPAPDIAEFWHAGHALNLLAELMQIDLERHFKAGRPVRMEGYLQRFPQLSDDKNLVVDCILTEDRLRRRLYPNLPSESLPDRFPTLREALLARRASAEMSHASGSLDTLPGVANNAAPLEAPLPDIAGYRILRLLGHGGMGIVYEAEDIALRRRVAVKVMRPEIAADPAARERFLREARAAAQLGHDHVVTIHQVGEARGVPFLSMQLLAGESLQSRLRRQRPLSPLDAARLGRQIASGLAAAHAVGLIHRDIKPANLWLESPKTPEDVDTVGPGRIKILDFGLARVSDDAKLTTSGAVIGTPAYMAPEQADGQPLDSRADLFSLGGTLYEATTGQRAFRGATMLAVLSQLAQYTPPDPHSVNADVPPALSELIMQLLAKRPEDRPKSAQVVAQRLRDIERRLEPAAAAAIVGPDAASSASTPSTIDIPLPRKTGSRRQLAVAAMLLVVLSAVAAVVVIRIQTPRGTLVIEIDDDAVEVIVQGEGATLRTKDRELKLRVGDYTIELAEPKAGLKLNTDRFSIGKDGKAVRVWLEKTPAGALADGFVPIFNGKDLTGWRTSTIHKQETKWFVQDGCLTASGPLGHLWTNRNYRDFHLRAEIKLAATGSSAIIFRSDQVKRTDHYNAPLIPKPGAALMRQTASAVTRWLAPRPFPTERWVTYEVIARGIRVVLRVDGEIWADVTDPEAILGPNSIGLQHFTPETQVQFRKIEIKELPYEEGAAPPIAPLPGKKEPAPPIAKLDPHRRVAEMVLKHGGSVFASSMQKPASRREDLPTFPFVLYSVNLSDSATVTDEALKEFAGVNYVQTLELKNTKVTDLGLRHLTGLDIYIINLTNTGVTDGGVPFLASRPDLLGIHLMNTAITDTACKHLGQMKRLRDLRLAGTKVGDTGFKELAGLRTLRQLELSAGCTVKGLAHLQRLRPPLQRQGSDGVVDFDHQQGGNEVACPGRLPDRTWTSRPPIHAAQFPRFPSANRGQAE